MAVTLGIDERTVTLEDPDGRWHGPLPVAYAALTVLARGWTGAGAFWTRIALPSA